MTRSNSGSETTSIMGEGELSAPPKDNLNAINDQEVQPPTSGEQSLIRSK